MFLGISSGAARLLIGRLCDVKWVNIRYINQLGITLAGLATLLLPLAKSYFSVALYTAVFGFSDGAFITSQNIILLSIVGPDRRDAAFGFGCMLCSFALAAGPPLAGECVVSISNDEFNSPQFQMFLLNKLSSGPNDCLLNPYDHYIVQPLRSLKVKNLSTLFQ